MIKELNIADTVNNFVHIKNSIYVLENFYIKLQEILNPQCIFEIGAYEAKFSKTIKSKMPNVESWAFEANPFNYNYFMDLNNFESLGINYLNLAISNINGKIKFFIQSKERETGKIIDPIRGNNSILERNDDTIVYEQVEVESVTITKFIDENFLHNKTKSMWIDIEGSNKNLLKDNSDCFKNVLSILIEVEEKEYWREQWFSSDVVDYFKGIGFIPIARDFDDNNQYNIVFVNEDLIVKNKLDDKLNVWVKEYFEYINLEVVNM